MSRPRVSRPAMLGALVAAVAFWILLEIRGYPWLLASLSGLAIGMLPYASLRAFEQIRQAVASMAPPDDDRWDR